MPARSDVWSVVGLPLSDLPVNCGLTTVSELPCKSEDGCFVEVDESDLSVACLCGEWSVPTKSVV